MNALLERWHAMTARERRMVALAGAAIALALVWLIAIQPALEGRARIAKELPRLREQAAELAGLAQLAAQRPPPRRVGGADLRGQIEASLEGLPVKPTVSAAANIVSVKFERVSYPAIAQWAARVARESGAHVESATVTTANEPGRANVEFGFAR